MEDKKIKVLMVDDEVDFTQTMAFWFKSRGYIVETASDGKSAIRMIKENMPDIVFLDLNMPVMDGEKTLRKIRKFKKDLPVIIISAYIEDQEKMKKVNIYGISGVFYKEKDFTEGLSLLETVLRTHKKLKK